MIEIPEGTHLAYTVDTDPEFGIDPAVIVHAQSDDRCGVDWEFQVIQPPEPWLRLSMFNDSWSAFAVLAPFFAALASGEVRTLDDVVKLLRTLGAVDETRAVT